MIQIRSKYSRIRSMLAAALVAIITITITYTAWNVLTKKTDAAGGMTFSTIATHPQAALQSTIYGKYIDDLMVDDGMLYAGYGDYDTNTGPIAINPFNLSTNSFTSSVLSIPTEQLMVLRKINGDVYAPMTDPRLAWTANVGFATNKGGVWQNKLVAPAVHVFDMATLNGSDLWMVGSSEVGNGTTISGAIAYRSTDNGATWSIVQSDQTTPPAQISNFERYYWVAELKGKIYMQAQSIYPFPPVRIFDGTTWTNGSTEQVCSTYNPALVEVFKDNIICANGHSSQVSLYNGTSVEYVALPASTGIGEIRDLYVADDGYLYAAGSLGVGRSIDGRVWSRLASTSSNIRSIAVHNDRIYLGTNDAKILRSDMTIANMPAFYTSSACFDIDASTGTVTTYYDYEGGDDTKPACSKDVIIPTVIDGVAIQHIGINAFSYRDLTSITIPSGIESIGSNAFISNKLNSVVIPGSVKTIGSAAFQGNDMTSVTLSNGLISIDYFAFYYNRLTTVTIPSSVTNIGYAAFLSNTISHMTLLGTPATIEADILKSNPVDSITHAGITYLTLSTMQPIPAACFERSGSTLTDYLYVDLQTIINSGVICSATDVAIPQSLNGVPITKIGDSAFYNDRITSVTIPNSVTSIGYGAFSSNNLQSVTIPSSVTSIASSAFMHNKLTAITIPSSITSIDGWTFYGNELTTANLPSSLKSIGDWAFASNRFTSITIPAGVNNIGNYVFYNNQLTAVTIPEGTTSIGDNAFSSNSITSVTIPGSAKTIGEYAFSSNKLASVTLTNGITTIGDAAFQSNNLTSITIPASVTSIGSSAFQYNNITSIIFLGAPSSISDDAFLDNALVSVTHNGVTYSFGDVMQTNQPLSPACFTHDDHTLTGYRYMDMTLVINSGVMCARSDIAIPQTLNGHAITAIGDWALDDTHLQSITIPSNITSIGTGAFYENQLTEITIPDSVTSLGDYAFASNKLTSIIIPHSITTIGDGVFRSNQLTSVDIPSSITRVGHYAFSDNQLTSLTIPSSLTSIGSGAFYINSLQSLTLPDTLTSVGGYAFEANQLSSLTLGCGVSALGDELFAINKLTTIEIPDCIKSVDPTTFFGQNPWGGTVESGSDPDHYWYSSDQNVLQTIHNNLWYARVYTTNQNNSNHLVDGVIDESWYTGDLNGDGDSSDSIGGHIINPASISARYVDESGVRLAADYKSAGRLNDGNDLTDYLIKHVQTPALADAQTPTVEEQASLEESLSTYTRIGQSISLAAPTISGYDFLGPVSPHTINLVNGDTSVSFTYRATQASIISPTPTQTPVPTKNPSIPPVNEGLAPRQSAVQLPQRILSAKDEIGSVSNQTTDLTDVTLPSRIDFESVGDPSKNPIRASRAYDLAPIMSNSTLNVDDSKSCSQITSAQLLPAGSFESPDENHTSLGGLAFVLKCAEKGGDAAVTFTLGETIANLKDVKVYKQAKSGKKIDITEQVDLTNALSGGNTRTTISYPLRDGESLDDDGKANRSITDPIYIVVPSEKTSPLHHQRGHWVNAGLLATGLLISIAMVRAITIFKKRHA